MLARQELAEILATLPTRRYETVLYRAIDLEALYGFHRNPPYPRPLPLFSGGAPAKGARFTPIEGPASLYLAQDPLTAYAEANRVYAQTWTHTFGTIPAKPPTVIISVEVLVEAVLDVTDLSIQKALHTTNSELIRPWRLVQKRGQYCPTQALGQAVFDSGRFQGICYPSAQAPGHHCFVIYTDRLIAPSYVEVADPRDNIRQRIP